MDLKTTYMGLQLAHPLVPSASPLSYTIDGIRRLEDAGAAAVVLHSLFEEQIEGESHLLDHYLSYGAHSFAEALEETVRASRRPKKISSSGRANWVAKGRSSVS